MGYLSGLTEYMDEHYNQSMFNNALNNGELICLYIYGGNILEGKILNNDKYDIEVVLSSGEHQTIKKTDIKFICHASHVEKINKIIKIDKKVAKKNLSSIIKIKERYHIKNKTLYPLMEERQVLIFTMLEGEQLKGIIANFSRYEITLNIKGGTPLTICRHAILNLSDKKNRCYLKSFQQKTMDWKNSQLYVNQET